MGILKGQHAQLVPDIYQAWHAEELNEYYLSIELAQPTIDDEFTNWQYEETARTILQWKDKYQFSLSYIFGHEETVQGQRNGKSDPGPMFDWEKLRALLAV